MIDTKIYDEIKLIVTKANLEELTSDCDEIKTQLTSEGIEIDDQKLSAVLLKKFKEISLKETKDFKENAPRRERKERSENNSSIQRFFINLGAVDGLDRDSLKTLVISKFPNVTESDFTDSYVKGTFSFFELPKEKIEGLVEAFAGFTYNDREVNVELSEKKPERRDGGRRSFGRRNDSYRGRSNSYGGGRSDSFRSRDDSRQGDRGNSYGRPSYRSHDEGYRSQSNSSGRDFGRKKNY